MFSESEREEILNSLVEGISKLDEITGIVIVGSASSGFRDRFSDIDIALVYDEGYRVENVFEKINDLVSRDYSIATVLNQFGRNLQVILLENYLEIDIGYYTKESIIARRENYKVVFDKTGELEEKMKNSSGERTSEYMGTTERVDILSELYRTDSNLWYNIFHSVNSFLRDEKPRCYFEIEELRRNLISLVGKRNAVETKRFRDVHKLYKSKFESVNKLFYYPKTQEELKNLLCTMVDMFYSEYEHWSFSFRLEKDFILEYIRENLNEKSKEE